MNSVCDIQEQGRLDLKEEKHMPEDYKGIKNKFKYNTIHFTFGYANANNCFDITNRL